MWPHRDAHTFKDRVVLLDERVINRHAGVVDGAVDDTPGVGLRHPAVVVDRTRPVAVTGGVEFVDRDDLARLWLGQQVVVVKTPPRGGIAAKGAAGECGIGATAQPDIEDAHLEDIARLGAAHLDGPGADVNPKPLTSAAPVDRRIERPGTTAIDVLFPFCPVKDAFRARISDDHPRIVVIGMVG
jgi:hypothetical protein